MSIAKQFMLLIGVFLLASCTGMSGQSNDKSNAVLAADEGNTDKGIRYLLGRGVAKNDTKAFYYFNQAARHGDPFAANELAFMYAVGKGTKQNYGNALKNYQFAADYGLASAQYNLGLMYTKGLGVPIDKQKAHYWISKSAAQGFKPARQSLVRA